MERDCGAATRERRPRSSRCASACRRVRQIRIQNRREQSPLHRNASSISCRSAADSRARRGAPIPVSFRCTESNEKPSSASSLGTVDASCTSRTITVAARNGSASATTLLETDNNSFQLSAVSFQRYQLSAPSAFGYRLWLATLPFLPFSPGVCFGGRVGGRG